MGMFDAMNDPSIPVGGDRLYFKEGSYRVQIDHCKSIEPEESKDGFGNFIAEVVVCQSTNPLIRPGAVIGWVQKFKKQGKKNNLKMAFASVKQFCAAAMRTPDPDSAIRVMGLVAIDPATQQQVADWNAFVQLVAGPGNPFRGMKVDLVCTEKNLADGGVFTVHSWSQEGTIAL